MPTSTNVTNLKINELTESQYDTAVQQGVIGANEISILTDAEAGQVIQVATLPTASADELDNIYQFIGTTDANYTNGYFYKCVSDGQQPATYSWSNIQVQASSGGLPSQTGNAGKFLTTDGTDASWSDKPLVNRATGTDSLAIGNNSTTASLANSVIIGYNSYTNGGSGSSVAIGKGVSVYTECVSIGSSSSANNYGAIAIGTNSKALATRAIQIGYGSNSESGTLCVGLYHNSQFPNYKLLSSDGTVPADRLVNAINKYSTMPTAASTNEGWIVQFTGTTDSTYTHGHLYECVSDGQSTPTYSWTEVQLGGGGSSYTAGTGIDITNGTISVIAPTLQNDSTTSGAMAIGPTGTYHLATAYRAISLIGAASGTGSVAILGTASGTGSLALLDDSTASANYAISIGNYAKAAAVGAIQIGGHGSSNRRTNSDANTFKVGNANGNFEMMSADGTIPTARLTKVNSTITLTSAGWSSNTQTVNVTGMTATGVVFVSPDPTDQADYTSAGIYCSAQAAGTLTFTCDTVPSGDIDVNVVML